MAERSFNKKIIYSVFSIFALVAIVVLVVLGLTECIGDTAKKEETEAEVDISCSWWGNDARHIYTIEGLKHFMEIYPEINVTHRFGVWDGYERRNRVSMLSNMESDVMQINFSWLKEYSEDGEGYYDLNELSDYIDLDNYSDLDLSYGMMNGKLNALPIAFNTSIMYYNQNLYTEYGLDLPETWDDLFEVASVISKDDKYVLGIQRKQLFLMMIAYYEQSTGERFFDNDGNIIIDEKGLQTVIKLYKEMIDKKVVMPVDSFLPTSFSTEDVSGIMAWVSDGDRYCNPLIDDGKKISIGEFLTMDGAKKSGWYKKPATMYAMKSDTDHPEEAAKLINYLLNDEYMAILQGTEKGVPVSKRAYEVLENSDAKDSVGFIATEKMNSATVDMYPIISAMENEDVINTFKEIADEYLYDQISLEDCSKKVLEAMKVCLKK